MRVVCLTILMLVSIVAIASASQTLTFPVEAIGTLFIHPQATVQLGYLPLGTSSDDGWQNHGPAAGSVIIPDGVAVRLILNRAAVNDLKWIDDLPADGIDSLDADGIPLGDEGFARLSRLTGVRQLSLYNCNLTSGVAAQLPHFQQLQSLWIGSNRSLDDDAMSSIASLPTLHSLFLTRTGVTDAGLEVLSTSHSVEAVDVGLTRITDKGIAALSKLPNLRLLSAMALDPEFRGNEPNPSITNMGLSSLRNCQRLEYLNISGSALTDSGLEKLVSDCPRLRHLTLDNTAITSSGLKHIGSLSQLEFLRCYGTRIDDSVVGHFQSLGNLKQIDGDVEVGNAGVEALASLPSLERLTLSGGKESPDDACMASIAAMKSLKDLSIQNTQITDDGFARLSGSRTLERVQLTGKRMTTRCVEKLASMSNLKQLGLMNVSSRTDGEPTWKGLEQLRNLKDELWLCDCPPLTVDDFRKFAEFSELARLRIEGGRLISDADIQRLRELDKLEFLQLTSSVISDEGLGTLGKLPSLERLFINCLATEEGLRILVRSPRLRHLQIGSPYLAENRVESVRVGNPNLTIRWTPFRLEVAVASRSRSADGFWRRGTVEERKELNALEGKPAPAISIDTWVNSGQDVKLDEFRGKVVLVKFWGTWCGPCLKQMPLIRQLHDKYSNQGLIVVGIHSTKEADRVGKFVSDNNLPWSIGVDANNQSETDYAVSHWPSLYLIDRAGVLRIANPMEHDLEEAIKSLLEE